jgi:hypothetical protein
MKWWWWAGALAACVAVIFGGLFAWRVHRQKVAEWRQVSELRARAELGDAAAEDKLGERYLEGRGVPKSFAEALLWLRKSADQGDARAETAIASAYFYGEGVPQNDAQALTWYRQAAEQGYPLAQQALGWMYFNGRGVAKDYTQAAAWYEKAADQGDAVSEATLGYMYARALGVERDRIGSLRWYRMAAAQGEPSAVRSLKSFRPAPRTRYLEVAFAFVAFFSGVVFASPSWEAMLPGRKLRDWRQPFEALLSVFLFAYSGLNLYASEHVIRYLPFHKTFHMFKIALAAAVVVIVVTVVLPARKKQQRSRSGGI